MRRGEMECCLHGPQAIQEKGLQSNKWSGCFKSHLRRQDLVAFLFRKCEVFETVFCNLVKARQLLNCEPHNERAKRIPFPTQ